MLLGVALKKQVRFELFLFFIFDRDHDHAIFFVLLIFGTGISSITSMASIVMITRPQPFFWDF